MKPRALLITGYGLNCDAETDHALTLAGAAVRRVHLNDLIADPSELGRSRILVIMGGFSYGDHLGAGRALAIRLRHGLVERLTDFVQGGGLVMGVCNGFQVLCKLGLLPGFDPPARQPAQLATLTHNDCGVFRDSWVRLRVNADSPCVFTRGLERLELPVRHGEGKFVVADRSVLDRLAEGGQVVYRYADADYKPTMNFPDNPNGSVDAIAGVCDPTGRIFGSMPHPEAFHRPEHHPDFQRRRALGQPPPEPLGLRLFQNAVAWAGEHATP